MKTRASFVSNSSTCSFVLIGMELTKDILTKEDTTLKDCGVDVPEDGNYYDKLESLRKALLEDPSNPDLVVIEQDGETTFGAEDGTVVLGFEVARFRSEDYDWDWDGPVSLSELIEIFEKAIDILPREIFRTTDIKIYQGGTHC